MKLATLIKIAKNVSNIAVSETDLKNYFKGEDWKNAKWENGGFSGETTNLKVSFKPGGWKVKIQALEDKSDSAESKTKDPVMFINKFLGNKPVFDPESPHRTMKFKGLFSSSRTATDLKFPSDWKSEKTADGYKINIEGEYEAKISRLYEYEFAFKKDDSLNETGETEDPITSLRKWRRSDKVEKALESLKERKPPQTIKPGTLSLEEMVKREKAYEELANRPVDIPMQDEPSVSAPTDKTIPPPKKRG